MKSKTAKLIGAIIFSVLSAFALNTYLTNPTHAINCQDSSISSEVKKAAGCSSSTTLPDVIENILNAVILVAGTIAVIFIIVGGVNYMTSAGDAGKVAKAKNTILYALIGLVICALAFAIVNWTIGVIRRA